VLSPIDDLATLPGGPAIYVATAADGRVLYVGSTARSPARTTPIRERVSEHLRTRARSQDWIQLTILPLRADTPSTVVRQLEGEIGRALRPQQNLRLPKVPRRR
jgi:hypothetical protein